MSAGLGILNAAVARNNSLTKPVGSLGLLEECGVRLAVLQNTVKPQLSRGRICVFGADHGVADDGVSAYPKSVTAEMMRNFARGGAAISVLARQAGMDVEVIDTGVDADLSAIAGIVNAKIARGTANLRRKSALSHEQLRLAMAVGASAVQRAVRAGSDALGLGEMGIGNTTSASALLAILTGASIDDCVGSGTGVTGESFNFKRQVVQEAVELHATAGNGPTEALRRVGGLEIAAMAGAAIEAASWPIALIADGFISTVAILAAAAIMRDSGEAVEPFFDRLFLSHLSVEPGHRTAIEALSEIGNRRLNPLLQLNLRLGEGTGAALAYPLLRSAAAIISEMATFADAGVSTGNHAEHEPEAVPIPAGLS